MNGESLPTKDAVVRQLMNPLAKSRLEIILRLTEEIRNGNFEYGPLEDKLALIDAYARMLAIG